MQRRARDPCVYRKFDSAWTQGADGVTSRPDDRPAQADSRIVCLAFQIEGKSRGRSPDPPAADQCASPADAEAPAPEQYRSISVRLALSVVPLCAWRGRDCSTGNDHSLAPCRVSVVSQFDCGGIGLTVDPIEGGASFAGCSGGFPIFAITKTQITVQMTINAKGSRDSNVEELTAAIRGMTNGPSFERSNLISSPRVIAEYCLVKVSAVPSLPSISTSCLRRKRRYCSLRL